MKRIIEGDDIQTIEKMNKLPKIYIVACWAHWGVRSYPFVTLDADNVPLVWNYNDHNGTADQYELVPLRHVTSASIFTWTFNEEAANKIAQLMEEDMQRRMVLWERPESPRS